MSELEFHDTNHSKRDFVLKLRQRVAEFFERFDSEVIISPECQRAFVSELNSCYVELLTEKNELLRATQELKIARDHYNLYYDLSPIASFSLDARGIILEANLTASRMLNVSRHNLRDQQHSFTAHLAPESYETFFTHLEQTLSDDAQKTCTLSILRIGESDSIQASLCSRRVKQLSGDWECLTFADVLNVASPVIPREPR